jgi:hypothetical protein
MGADLRLHAQAANKRGRERAESAIRVRGWECLRLGSRSVIGSDRRRPGYIGLGGRQMAGSGTIAQMRR